jgi:hypothetical protein
LSHSAEAATSRTNEREEEGEAEGEWEEGEESDEERHASHARDTRTHDDETPMFWREGTMEWIV